MKKILLLFAIALAVVSCQDEASQSSKVINVQIKASDWLSYNDSAKSCKFYYYNSSVPEMNSTVFKSGNVYAFVEDSIFAKALPYTIRTEKQGTDWTRSTTFSYSEGKMTFYVIYPSLNSSPPAVSNFRVVITD